MHVLTFSDDWGPFQCQFGEDCKKETHSIILTDEEYAMLPPEGGEAAALFISATGVGEYICKTHLKELNRK